MEIVLRNLKNKNEIKLSDFEPPFILEENGVDFGEAEVNFSSVDDVRGLGKTVTGVSFIPRPISLIGWIVKTEKESVSENKKKLNKILNPLNDLELIVGEYKIKVQCKNSLKESKTYTKNNSYFCNFVLDFIAFYPFFKLKDDNIVQKSESVGNPIFPLIIPKNKGKSFGRLPYNSVNQIYNTGDIDVGFELTVSAVDGPIGYLKCISSTLNESLTVREGLKKDEKMIVSTKTGEKFVKKVLADGSVIDITNKITSDSSLFLLVVGANKLDFESDNNSVLTFSIKFSPSFMEVV